MLRVAVVDDHPVARFGLNAILGSIEDVEVVASIAAPAELPRDPAGALAVDLVLLDLYLDDGRPAVAWTIVIEPSMGFGTGHHASTRLCLRLLQRHAPSGARVRPDGVATSMKRESW